MALTVMKGIAFNEERLLKWLDEDGCVIVQPKRDEIRCIVRVECGGFYPDGTQRPDFVSFTSAAGKPLYNLDTFAQEFIGLSERIGVDVFDTGVLVNDSFDVTRSVVRSSKKGYDLLNDYNTAFYMYDLPALKLPYMTRLGVMLYNQTTHIRGVNTAMCTGMFSVNGKYEWFISQGLEGAMVKRVDHEYKVGRTTNWMKMKPQEEIDGIITGYMEGEGKYKLLIGSLEVTFADGSKCFVSGMDDETRKHMTDNFKEMYLGKVVEVHYMMRDSQGGYRHPRFYRMHPDKITLE